MAEAKKTEKANLERRRGEMFLLALVVILSCVYCALEWNMALYKSDSTASIEDIMEDIDLDRLKKDFDMVAAISEIDLSEVVGNIVVATEIEQTEELLSASEETSEGSGDVMDEEEELMDVPSQLLITPLNEHESLVVMEQLPEFPGGASAFMKWITANVKYPRRAQDLKIEGSVVVSFIVDTEGNPTMMKLEKSTNPMLGSFVLGVMRNMPKWKPGVQNGKICPAMIRVPINFEL